MLIVFHVQVEDMASSRSQQRTRRSTASSATSCELVKPTGKNLDMAWEWNSLKDINNRQAVTCDFCGKTTTGGITRAKKHQLGVKGDVFACTDTPADVKAKIKEAFDKKKKPVSDAIELKEDDDEEEIYKIGTGKKRAISGSNPAAKREKTVKDSMDLVLFKNPEASIKLGNAKIQASKNDGCDMEARATHGSSQKSHPFRKQGLELANDMLKGYESQYGCSLMCDAWTNRKGRTFMNFLINCPYGTMFAMSVDASECLKSGKELFKQLDSLVQEIGEQNIVQVVTDNGCNYALAGKYLEAKRPRLFWTPCASHSVDLMLEDIGKIPRVESVIQRGFFLVDFVYNHAATLNTMRKFTNQMELVKSGVTRFATTFLTLERLYGQRNNLRKMFTSDEWLNTEVAKEPKGKRACNIVLMKTFWNDVFFTLKAMGPLVQVMRLVNNEKKPAMGYIYGAMDRAKEAIEKSLKGNEAQYSEIFAIIDKRWECQLHHPLHAAGHFLNPQYFYSDPRVDQDPEVSAALYKCIERLSPNDYEVDKATQQLAIYRRSEGLFSMKVAIRQRAILAPAEWWRMFGKHIPSLQTIAITILSLTCSSLGCGLNRRTFEQIHSKKRSKLERQKLQERVFMKYNQALRDRFNNHDLIDPIFLNNIDDCNDWLVGEMDGDGEAAEDELIFGDDSPTRVIVADAVRASEPTKLTRQQTRFRKIFAPTSSSRKGKEVVRQEEEEDSEETENETEEEEKEEQAETEEEEEKEEEDKEEEEEEKEEETESEEEEEKEEETETEEDEEEEDL